MHLRARSSCLRKKRGALHHRFLPGYKAYLLLLLLLPGTCLYLTSHLLPPPSDTFPLVTSRNPPLQKEKEHQRLAPRRTRFTFTPDRSYQPPFEASIHTILLCPQSDPCCIDNISHSVSALLAQTLVPTHLTLLHKCVQHDKIRRTLRNALEFGLPKTSSYALYPASTHHMCNTSLSTCALNHLSVSSEVGASAYTLLLETSHILEAVALEKLFLSLYVRPHVPALLMRAYDEESLGVERKMGDGLAVRQVLPAGEFDALPVLINVASYREALSRSLVRGGEREPFNDVMAKARVLREALYTKVGSRSKFLLGGDLPAQLFSERAAHKWAAQRDEDEMYADDLVRSQLNMRPVPFGKVKKQGVEIFLVLPWMEMGGSEKCMLDIAERTLNMSWSLTFVLTMPFWREDLLGEIGLEHQWLNKATVLSVDTFDLLALGPHDKSVRIFRHLLESRNPDFVLMANSRWAYGNSRLIKAISPYTTVVDYNHMIHMNWEGGGMPRYGANNSRYFDLHLTASRDVADAMKGWIDEDIMLSNPDKVQTCHIGTDPGMLYDGIDKVHARRRMRDELGIPESQVVVLFAGRFVVDKGVDVMTELVKKVAADQMLAKRIVFVFVGSGDQEFRLRNLHHDPSCANTSRVIIRTPAQGLLELREYYALSDVLVLPSVNEGIALVVYEAMASGVLVVTTDVGGQNEVVTPDTGVLLPNFRSISRMTSRTLETLKEYVEQPSEYSDIIQAGHDLVRSRYTTEAFRSCVTDNLVRVHRTRGLSQSKKEQYDDLTSDDLKKHLTTGAIVERYHGYWNRNNSKRSVENSVTIGIKTYVCDQSIVDQVHGLIRSIRVHHPKVRILLGNDGPIQLREEEFLKNDTYTEEISLPSDCGISYGRNRMVNLTNTRYFLLLDDDHVFDDTTNLTVLVDGISQDNFDLVGLRVRHLPGIDELERSGVLIPRYVALIRKLENRELTLCVWNENKGPSIYGITHPIQVDVLHNAFIGATEVMRAHPWRNELKVNEHMTYFLDAKDAALRVGYLPSVFVHHRSREYSDCYYKVRFREEKYSHLLRYKEEFNWDLKCQSEFPERIRTHILENELDL